MGIDPGWREPQKIAVKSADGITDLYGVMYTPFDMDSTRKYPLVVYVYPGPQEDQVPQAFSMDDNGNQALAQLGLIVIHIGYRGANGSFVIIGCCTSTSRFHIFNQQVLGPCVFEIEGMGYRFTLGDVTEVPGLLYPFHPGVGWRNGRILFFFTRKKK